MVGTLAMVIGVSTLFLAVILNYLGRLTIFSLLSLVIAFNLAQWLIAPYIIDSMYQVKEVSKSEAPRLHRIVEELSRKMGLKKPRIMIARLPIPNAFAYGSPIAGSRIAVTEGLLSELEEEEVEAVVGHELGHLKHRDVQLMMMASLLPALFYFIGYSLFWSSMLGRREERSGGLTALLGIASLAIYWVLSLLVLHLSRLREYYADRASATTVPDGARKLSEALAKIALSARRAIRRSGGVGGLNAFKTLFIEDPDRAERDSYEIYSMRSISSSDQQLVRELLSRPVTLVDRIMELFSTHPNMTKRLRALASIGSR
ncbi:MAG: M48 family metalloprotease [Candidatus Nezhaarchaeales archaeon]